MKLVLLGTGGYHPSDTRQTACVMLPELGVLLDAGTAMYRARDLLRTDTLDIFLSHAHLDHIIGLTYLFDILHEKQVSEVRVHGEAHKLKQIEAHLFAELLFPARPPLKWTPLTDKVELTHGACLSCFPLEHPGGSMGFRLDGPHGSLAYVTDTTADVDAAYVEQIRGVDLLIHECYFADDRKEHAQLTGHSCATSVGQVANRAQVGRLILVHVNPMSEDRDEKSILQVVRSIFPNVEMGVDGMAVE